MSNFPLTLFMLRAFLSYLEQFLFWIVFQIVHKPAFLNRRVQVTRIGGCSFNTFHWQAASGIYTLLCKALVLHFPLNFPAVWFQQYFSLITAATLHIHLFVCVGVFSVFFSSPEYNLLKVVRCPLWIVNNFFKHLPSNRWANLDLT